MRSFVWTFVSSSILQCAPDKLPICSYIRRNNFYWVTIPMCLSYTIVLSVTVYVLKIIARQQAAVAPTVHIPHLSTSDSAPEAAAAGTHHQRVEVSMNFRGICHNIRNRKLLSLLGQVTRVPVCCWSSFSGAYFPVSCVVVCDWLVPQ